jgi:protein ImuB
MERRIAAIVLPQLGCELVRQKLRIDGPLAVLLRKEEDGEGEGEARDRATATLDLVDEAAFHYGVRPGQRVAEALALLASLAVHEVGFAEIDEALGRVAELALAFGPTTAIRLAPERRDEARAPSGDAPFDTVWVDVTGAAHLFGGEEALLEELCQRVAALGHRVRAAIASGPHLARALARFAGTGLRGPGLSEGRGPHPWAIAAPGARALAPLPLHALPLSPDVVAFFIRLGVFTVDALGRLPRAQLASRLGTRAPVILDLVAGHDSAPLVPFTPPRVLVEETSFDDGVHATEPLLFVLRAMTDRIAARLDARGEACLALEITIPYDRSIARLRAPDREETELRLTIELPAPLTDAGDLLRALRAKLERVDLLAPAVGIRLTVDQIVEAPRIQIDLSRDKAARPDALPALLAELSAEIGAERVGVLEVLEAHRPEARSRLVPVHDTEARRAGVIEPSEAANPEAPPEPTRLLPTPIPLGKLAKGAVVAVDRKLFAVERLRFVMRLDGVEWWTAAPASRDYATAWLVAGETGGRPGAEKPRPLSTEAWVYVDRATGEGYLQGYLE